MKSIEDRIEFLKKCSDLYETGGNSSLTDAEYDKEYEECKKLMPDHPFFHSVGGIDDEHIYGTPFKHKYIMGSLNKDPNPEEFKKWFAKTFNDTKNLSVLLDLKVDGLSLCCHYQNRKLIRVVTRGDGITGIDVTRNAVNIKDIPKEINTNEEVEIKGEGYKNRQDFYKDWAGEYANPRNFTAGSINQKDPDVTKKRGLSFIAYEVRGIDFKTEIDKTEFLIKNNFKTLKEYSTEIDCTNKNADDVSEIVNDFMFKVDRDYLPFDIDGIVFKLVDIDRSESMGTTDGGRRPKATRAIKFPTEQKEAILEDIEWSIGRTGSMCPVGLLSPTQLAGTIVKRVSLHNLKEMQRLGITKTGCKVLVEKAGDIIPKIVKKISEGFKKIEIPDYCPICKTKIEWDNTQTTKFCKNEECPAQMNGRIEHWFKTLGSKGIGIGIIERVMDNFNIRSISDFYNIREQPLKLSELFGDKSSQNIIDSINSVKEISLAKFIEGLGIGKIGTMAKDIVSIAPTIEDIDKLKVSDISVLDGFGEIKALSFISRWKNQRNEIQKILNYVVISIPKSTNGKLSGKKICFTGTFSNPTRKEMEKMTEDNGGILSSVSKNLTALVWDGSIQGNKIEKAKQLGLKIINQKEFMEMLK